MHPVVILVPEKAKVDSPAVDDGASVGAHFCFLVYPLSPASIILCQMIIGILSVFSVAQVNQSPAAVAWMTFDLYLRFCIYPKDML